MASNTLIEVRIEKEKLRGDGEAIFRTPLTSLTNSGAKAIEEDEQRFAPRDTGDYQKSIKSQIVYSTGVGYTSMSATGPTVSYAPGVEFGQKPHFVPLTALMGWASRHAANPILVQRGILRRGTKPQHNLRLASIAVVAKLVRLVERAGAQIGLR